MCNLCFSFYFLALRQNKQSFNPADTNALVSAVAFGKGLSKCRPPGPVAPGHPGQVTMNTGTTAQAAMGGGVVPQQQGQPGKRLRYFSCKTNKLHGI